MRDPKIKIYNSKFVSFSLCLCVSVVSLFSSVLAQTENPPPPGAPRPVQVPKVQETSLPNGLKVVVVERKNVPLVTAQLLVLSGSSSEEDSLAGLANTTASILLKGTKTRTATQIAEEMEFLGGNIDSAAGWNSSQVTINVTSDKLDKAMAIMADTILNPTFLPKEIELFKTQTLDELNVLLKQPGNLASFVASRYTFGEHTALGTPETISKFNQSNLSAFYKANYTPKNSVLILTGDVSLQTANALAKKYFGIWKTPKSKMTSTTKITVSKEVNPSNNPVFKRILVIDLPNSGQAAVNYAKRLDFGRISENSDYFSSIVANTILGGGYSARLNQEIRIKRGLSYGAGSSITWRKMSNNIFARAQTKNVSAAEVTELLAGEIGKLGADAAMQDELTARKLTLTGDFGRDLATTGDLAARIADLYTFGLKPDELNTYIQNVQKVSDAQVKNFAMQNIRGGDIIIVGDAKVFMDDLKKRFPNIKIEVIRADELDLSKDNLRKN